MGHINRASNMLPYVAYITTFGLISYSTINLNSRFLVAGVCVHLLFLLNNIKKKNSYKEGLENCQNSYVKVLNHFEQQDQPDYLKNNKTSIDKDLLDYSKNLYCYTKDIIDKERLGFFF